MIFKDKQHFITEAEKRGFTEGTPFESLSRSKTICDDWKWATVILTPYGDVLVASGAHVCKLYRLSDDRWATPLNARSSISKMETVEKRCFKACRPALVRSGACQCYNQTRPQRQPESLFTAFVKSYESLSKEEQEEFWREFNEYREANKGAWINTGGRFDQLK